LNIEKGRAKLTLRLRIIKYQSILFQTSVIDCFLLSPNLSANKKAIKNCIEPALATHYLLRIC